MNHRQPTEQLKPLSAKFPRYSAWTLLRTMAALALGYILLLSYMHYQGDARIRRLFGGSTGLGTLQHADRIEAYRIGKIADSVKSQEAGLNDYGILKGPLAVAQADSQKLSRTLQDRNSYFWDAAKGCIMQPGVRFDFIRGNDRLSVLLCFECDILETFLDGKPVSGGNFDYARPTLIELVRPLFPDDPKIQSLTEQR
jgi:hypothetical protein